MEVNYLYGAVASTVLSLVGLQLWANTFLDGIKSEELVVDRDWISLLLGSNVTVLLLVNLALNLFLLVILCLKCIFFEKLSQSESRKVLERTVNYLIYKGALLPLVVPPNVSQLVLWLSWLILLCSLKMLQALARDRLERLNASPSVTPSRYFRVFSALIFVLCANLLWLKFCVMIYKSYNSNLLLLLFFEPLGIAFETLQAMMVYTFQLLEIWRQHSRDSGRECVDFGIIYKIFASNFYIKYFVPV